MSIKSKYYCVKNAGNNETNFRFSTLTRVSGLSFTLLPWLAEYMYPDEISSESEFDKYLPIFKVIFFVKTHVKLICISLALLATGIFYVYKLVRQTLSVPVQVNDSEGMVQDEVVSTIFVDVSGAITNPGVFELPKGSRIVDVLKLAGPITNNASITWVSQIINLAQLLQDGQKIYIPFEHDLDNTTLHEVLFDLKESYESTESVTPAISDNEPVPAGLVNVNTASQAQLNELPGVGDTYSEKIVANRPYKDIADLTAKTKISPKIIDKFRSLISF